MSLPEWPPNSQEILESIRELFATGKWWVYKGPAARAFENRFATYHGCRFGVSVCNGMVALDVTLRALGIGDGDRVIVPAYNYFSVAKSVLNVGAEPVFVDVSDVNPTIDCECVAAELQNGASAVIAVHISGSVARLDELGTICHRAGVPLIEDCAQAHGASYGGRRVGGWGAAGLFSFGGVKLMTCGQGGIVVTSDPQLYERVYALANRGWSPDRVPNRFGLLGDNYEMSDLAAAALGPQLDILDALCDRREALMRSLDQAVSLYSCFEPLRQFPRTGYRSQMRYSFWYRQPAGVTRDQLIAAANHRGIPVGGAFPVAPRDALLFGRFPAADCPRARRASECLLSVMHQELLAEEYDWPGAIRELARLAEG